MRLVNRATAPKRVVRLGAGDAIIPKTVASFQSETARSTDLSAARKPC